MKTFQTIIFFLSLGLLIIAAHQTFTVGFYESYWLFMLSLVLLFIYSAMKKQTKDSSKGKNAGKKKKKPVKKK